jgi:D-beta-D-heptose 7-phosphate kinase/D-beta-D-heptose 1-phosphate adenosyltransferase
MHVDPVRVRELVACFPRVRVLVVGDVMLDQFLIGRVSRISPEAPVPVVEFLKETWRLGGAANVARNVRTLGATVDLVGVVGVDAAAETLRAELAAGGIGDEGLVADPRRPTTRKLRIVTTRNQQVARVDHESDSDVTGEVEAALAAHLAARLPAASIVIVSDYLKGVVTRGLTRWLVSEAAVRQVPTLVDPKIPHMDYYAGATLVTPNHHEAESATARRIRDMDGAREVAREFRRRVGCQSVLITWGEHGMWLLEGRPAPPGVTQGDVVSEMHLDAAAREVADVTGAGDTVIATIALGLAAGGSLAEAAALANHAAGVAVGHFGPAAVSPQELQAAIGAAARIES